MSIQRLEMVLEYNNRIELEKKLLESIYIAIPIKDTTYLCIPYEDVFPTYGPENKASWN